MDLKTYVSRNILNTLPEHLINMLWNIYFNTEDQKENDIHIFRLSKETNIQLILHSQLGSKHKKFHKIKLSENDKPIAATVYITKQEDAFVMMLASDR